MAVTNPELFIAQKNFVTSDLRDPKTNFSRLANGAKLWGKADAHADLKAPRDLLDRVNRAIPGVFADLLLNRHETLGDALTDMGSHNVFDRVGLAIVEAGMIAGRDIQKSAFPGESDRYEKAFVRKLAAERVGYRYISILQLMNKKEGTKIQKMFPYFIELGRFQSKLAITDPATNLVVLSRFEARLQTVQTGTNDRLRDLVQTTRDICFPKGADGRPIRTAIRFDVFMKRMNAAGYCFDQGESTKLAIETIEKALLEHADGTSAYAAFRKLEKKGRTIAKLAGTPIEDERGMFIQQPIETSLMRHLFWEKVVHAIGQSKTYSSKKFSQDLNQYRLVRRVVETVGRGKLNQRDIMSPTRMYQEMLEAIPEAMHGKEDSSENRRFARALLEAAHALFPPSIRRELEISPKLHSQNMTLARVEQKFLEATMMPVLSNPDMQPRTAPLPKEYVYVKPTKNTSVGCFHFSTPGRLMVPLSVENRTRSKLVFYGQPVEDVDGSTYYVVPIGGQLFRYRDMDEVNIKKPRTRKK